ncbi:hypothetical protein CDL12_17099 [Handroanthus impetiginosus]|uniref:FAR1 domain-containing protein n=1 Tax=Handroanthus impetiginosus TaxID=429701 RepID=A0A2G9GYF1_9LAMI|nr:hypothetical protein CDL12_17099 [Handroanthus impetiginosus]
MTSSLVKNDEPYNNIQYDNNGFNDEAPRSCRSESTTNPNEALTSITNCMVPDFETITQLVFESDLDADLFYLTYGRDMGFDIRRCHKKTIDSWLVKNREWVCSRAGYWKDRGNNQRQNRRPKSETQYGCPAAFWVAHDIVDGLYKSHTLHHFTTIPC